MNSRRIGIDRPVPPLSSRLRAGVLGAGALAVVLVLVLAAPLTASAHVHVDPDTAEPGAYSTLTFTVPNESAKATTTRVEVTLPTATPLSYLAVEPVPGWTADVERGALPRPAKVAGTTVTEAPLRVVWRAEPGTELGAGQFQRFAVQAGPVPDTGKLLLAAKQTYSDGTVVDWDQPTPASGEEPEHPAPVLYVRDAPPAEHAGGQDSRAEPAGATDRSSAASAASSLGPLLALASGAAVLALAALVVAVLALLRGRRPA